MSTERVRTRTGRDPGDHLRRRLIQLGLAGNAVHPVPAVDLSIPAMFAGWLTGELAPQLLALTALDVALELARPATRSNRRATGLAASALSGVAYASMIRTSSQAGDTMDAALRAALGSQYRTLIAREPRPDDPLRWTDLARFRTSHPDVIRHRGLSYAPGGRRFELDVFHHRDKPSGRPVLLQVHGGGWVSGNKDQQGQPLLNHMAARGWVCVAVNYPLAPKARLPEQLTALKRAVHWIRANIETYGGAPSFIAATGGSAGGHLAAMLALTSDDPTMQPGFEDADTAVQACIPHYGIYDFTDGLATKMTKRRTEKFLGPMVMARDAVYPDDYRAASPLYRVRSDAPPFLVIHGSADTFVPVNEARSFVARLRAVTDNAVAYAELPGAQHSFDTFPSIRSAHVLRGVEYFLEWCFATSHAVGHSGGMSPPL